MVIWPLRRAGLELDPVLLRQLQLRGILDADDPFLLRDVAGQDVEQGGLARARAARDHDVAPHLDAGLQEPRHRRRQGPESDQAVHAQQVALEFPDGDARSLQRQRRNDGIDAAAVGKARIDEGGRLVDVASQRRDDALDHAHHRLRRAERFFDALQLAFPLHVDLGRAVDHDLADRVVGEPGLQRTEPEGFVEHVLDQLVAVEVRIQLPGLVHPADDLPDARFGLLPQLVGPERVEIQPAQVQRLDQPAVHELQRLSLRPGRRGARHRGSGRDPGPGMGLPARRLPRGGVAPR